VEPRAGPGDVTADLLRDTAPSRADGPGRWAIELSAAWDFKLPSGGVLQTASLRAAEAELADANLRLVSASTIFCTPIAAGTLDTEVTILRRGHATAQVRIALRGRGAPEAGLETIATFARDRAGPDLIGARFPDVPLPDDCDDLEDGAPGNAHGRVRFFGNLDCRLARGARFWRPGWQGGAARYARWFRYRVPVRDGAGQVDRAAYPPLVDTMPAALAQGLGPSPYRFFAPSLDLTVHVVDDTDRDWILASAYARRARAGTAIAEVELWDDRRRLVAYGTQTMYIRGVTGDPPQGVVAGS
jgi:acyl-CoA thioesterase